MELKSLWTTDLCPMIHIWESSRGKYLRRTLLMISATVKFSESQKAQQDKKTFIVTISIYLSTTSKNKYWYHLKWPQIDLRSLGIAHWALTLFWYFAIICFIGIYFDILHLIFCDYHRVGDGQKAFFDTVVENTVLANTWGIIWMGNTVDTQYGT